MKFIVYKPTKTRLGNLYFFMTSELEGWTYDETGATWFDIKDIEFVIDRLGNDMPNCRVILSSDEGD